MALPPDPPQNQPRRPQSKKMELKFEPLSDGLGFHPFSDGLPYAPMAKTPTTSSSKSTHSNGSGAVAAGAPSYAPPMPRAMPAPRIPISAPAAAAAAAANALANGAVISSPIRPAASTPAPLSVRGPAPFAHPQVYRQPAAPNKVSAAEAIAATLTPDLLQPHFGIGYVFKRVFAYLVDSLFNLGLCAGALSAALWKQDLSPDLLFSPGIVLVAALFLGFFNWAITTAEEVAFGTSIGKRLFGLAIQGGASAIFLRAFFFIPGVCFGGLGLVWALFDRRRRCWHDLVVDLQPIEIAHL